MEQGLTDLPRVRGGEEGHRCAACGRDLELR